RVDALVTMSSRVLTVGADLNGAQVRPHLALVVDDATWAAARRHADEVDTTVAVAVDATHGNGAAFGLDPHGQPLSVTDVQNTQHRTRTAGTGDGDGDDDDGDGGGTGGGSGAAGGMAGAAGTSAGAAGAVGAG